jgi:hypothetical protein
MELTSEKKFYEQVAKKLGKYESAPPTIEEFLCNPYYLGEETKGGERVFPYWKAKLQELYPTPFYEYDPDKKLIILSGATGIGKCFSGDQEIEIYVDEETIKKLDLEEFVIE